MGRQGPPARAARRGDLPAGAARRSWPARSRCSAAATASRRPGAWPAGTAATQFDPAVVDLFCEHAGEVLDGLDEAAELGRRSSTPSRALAGGSTAPTWTTSCEAMADLVDLKSPYLAGHSRGVANLAAEAARVSGLSDDEVRRRVRRAGLLHDLGRLGRVQRDLGQAGPAHRRPSASASACTPT